MMMTIMQILPVTSKLDQTTIQKRLEQIDAIAIRTGLIKSLEEFKLAEHLAVNSFKNKKNIANKFKYEFLLWLTGKRDIRSAIEETKPDKREFVVVMFSRDNLACIEAKKSNLKIEKDADPLSLERVSLSRLR